MYIHLLAGYVGPLPAQAAVHHPTAVTAQTPVRVIGNVQTPDDHDDDICENDNVNDDDNTWGQ